MKSEVDIGKEIMLAKFEQKKAQENDVFVLACRRKISGGIIMINTWIKTLVQDRPEGDGPINQELSEIQKTSGGNILDVKHSFAFKPIDGGYVNVYLTTYESNVRPKM